MIAGFLFIAGQYFLTFTLHSQNLYTMKKYFMILLASGFLMACAGQGDRQTQESSAEVQLEAELEEALEKNIELNERIAELEAELEELTDID
jgi:uncharacterized protein YceH (UPF0502 family)